MATEHTCTVTLGSGVEVDVFDRYTVTLDMMHAGNPWTVSMWHSTTRRATWDVLRREVKLGAPLTLAIDGAAQVTGRIETLETHVGRGGATLVVSGRVLGGVAMSWDADPTVRLRGLPLSDALTALFLPLGLPLVVTDAAAARIVQSGTNRTNLGPQHHGHRRAAAPVGPVRGSRPAGRPHSPTRGVSRAQARHRAQPIDRSHPRAGEHVWALADEMCRRLGFLLWVAPFDDGGLGVVVDVPYFAGPDVYQLANRTDPAAFHNVLKCAEKLSVKDVPTEVNVYTGTTRGDLISNRTRSQTFNVGLERTDVSRGFVVDPMTPQVRHIKSSRSRTISAAAREGERVVAEAMAGFRRYECTVQGHGQTVGGVPRLYALNTMAHVRDDLCTAPDGTPLDESMLITGVTFNGSRQAGTTTDLVLVPKDSIQVIPQEAA